MPTGTSLAVELKSRLTAGRASVTRTVSWSVRTAGNLTLPLSFTSASTAPPGQVTRSASGSRASASGSTASRSPTTERSPTQLSRSSGRKSSGSACQVVPKSPSIAASADARMSGTPSLETSMSANWPWSNSSLVASPGRSLARSAGAYSWPSGRSKERRNPRGSSGSTSRPGTQRTSSSTVAQPVRASDTARSTIRLGAGQSSGRSGSTSERRAATPATSTSARESWAACAPLDSSTRSQPVLSSLTSTARVASGGMITSSVTACSVCTWIRAAWSGPAVIDTTPTDRAPSKSTCHHGASPNTNCDCQTVLGSPSRAANGRAPRCAIPDVEASDSEDEAAIRATPSISARVCQRPQPSTT